MKDVLINLIAVFVGGGIGATLRYIATLGAKLMGFASLYSTFGVNIIGCFVIGYIFALNLYKFEMLSPLLKLFLTVGILGALTTFSTFNLEIFELIKTGKISAGFCYLFSSCLFGLLATFLGYKLGILLINN